ncbi:MAG TPA: hypothetical protein VFL14_07295 [Xanthomonadales bacterium]|nr:hypothetical protein [Xanthomonadales bacterium]
MSKSLAVLLLSASSLASAQPRDCPALHWEGDDVARSATVSTDDARTHFVHDAPAVAGCPSADATCRMKAYLVPGDEVVVWFEEGDYACASYVAANGRETAGFLPTASLAIADAPKSTPQSAWVGTWTRDEAEVRIVAEGDGAVAIEGDATWGTHDPDRVERGGVHIGTIDRTVVPIGNAAVLRFAPGEEPDDPSDEYRCRVALQRVGDRLLVDDNFQCGGMNVSFDGIYVRD